MQLVSPHNTWTKQQTVYSSLFTRSRKPKPKTSWHGLNQWFPISTFTCTLSSGSIFYLPLHPSFSYSPNKDKDHPMVLMGLSSSHLHCPSLNLRMALGPLGRQHSEMGADLLLTGNFYPTCKRYRLQVSAQLNRLKWADREVTPGCPSSSKQTSIGDRSPTAKQAKLIIKQPCDRHIY